MSNGRIGAPLRQRIEELWPEMLSGLATGRLVRDVLRDTGISQDSIRTFLSESAQRRVEWDGARERSADALFDEALDVARDPFEEVEADVEVCDADGSKRIERRLIKQRRDPSHARTYIDTLKWAARIRNPRLYGDKQQLDVNVKTVDLTAVIFDANKRLAAAQVGRVIEGEVVRTALADMM